ncbi:DNA polymerase IV [Jeotgalibacillus proteolyticus]|uniref:DNA polymerase IV n=1 Tax=Jeotgalibacillus proteolyticus TaxID=2082395 RepID=A0A2S5GEG7_9BACL|nr:DNA polymerase IV [Jeotgalibacillus proteolyticus]PPA71338.1 DNA polymerase IV [Jeotgalibacillus proteolyticus]
MKKSGRIILHVDMNSFYASVEAAHDASLKGKPIAIAGDPEERRGIVVTCSYEARAYGVKTTMPLWEAKKLCPSLLVLRPNFERYRQASKAMFDILRSYTSQVEPVSIDEGYMDLTELEGESPIEVIKTIQDRILRELDLPCSIGVAPNKFLAKMASDMKKPMGITVLRKRDVPQIMWPMPVEAMHGVGAKTAEKLKGIGINIIGDLALGEDIQLKALLGINGRRLKDRANGLDERKVDPDSIYDFKSVGNSTTLPADVTNQSELIGVLLKLSKKVSGRLKSKAMLGYGVSIMIRFKDRKTITRSCTLKTPVDGEEEILSVAKGLLLAHWDGTPVRLLGVTVQELVEKRQAVKQLDLFTFEEDARHEPIDRVLEEINKRYGTGKLNRGIPNAGPTAFPSAETSFSKDFLRDHK